MFKTTKEAIEFILKTYGITKYRLAANLGAAPASINQWLNKTRMTRHYADLIMDEYEIYITDVR